MRVYGPDWLKASVAEKLKHASIYGEFDGVMSNANAIYLEDCKAFHSLTGTLLIFTRDTGHHTSGWFKNPDYERCLHLSLSFREPFNQQTPVQFNIALAKEWAELFFGEYTRLIWAESPKTEEGKYLEVHHYRVFCNGFWQPFIPRKEVYTTDFTEKGWRSWSELHPAEGEPSSLYAG